MIRKATVLLAPLTILLAFTTARAADKEVQGGLRKALPEVMPELIGLPEGTFGMEFEVYYMAGDQIVKYEIEAESREDAFKVDLSNRPRKAKSKALFAKAQGDPNEVARTVLLALHQRDYNKLRELIDPEEVEKAIEEIGKEIEEIEKKAGSANGITLERIAREFLPSVVVPPITASLKYGYAIRLESGGVKGELEVGFEMAVADKTRPRWVVSGLEVEFKAREAKELVPNPVLKDGMAAFLSTCALPDIADFPAGTGEISVEWAARINGTLYEMETAFDKIAGSHVLIGFKARLAEMEDAFCPEKAPRECPLESIKKVMKAFRAGDIDALLPYMPGDMKEMADDPEFREMFKKQMTEEMAREEKKKGYAPDTAILAAVPAFRTPLGPCAIFGVNFSHPVTIKGKDGLMKIELEFVAENGNEGNYVIKDMDAIFDSGEGEDGSDGEKSAPDGEED